MSLFDGGLALIEGTTGGAGAAKELAANPQAFTANTPLYSQQK
jgi:hypothetical protein